MVPRLREWPLAIFYFALGMLRAVPVIGRPVGWIIEQGEGQAMTAEGGSSKYGRLFTEADVVALMAHAIVRDRRMAAGALPERLARRILEAGPTTDIHLTFPADEPLFLLRGQDSHAGWGITAYVSSLTRGAALHAGVSAEHRGAATEAMRRLLAWQAANPDRVKVPD